MKGSIVATSLALAFAFTGCSNPPVSVTARGLSSHAISVVKLNAPPANDTAAAVVAKEIDAGLTKFLDENSGKIIDEALARYEKDRADPQNQIETKIPRDKVEIVLESVSTRAEDESSVRKEADGFGVIRFRFTLRPQPAKYVATDPARFETDVTMVEDSNAPQDTISFSTDVRAALLDDVNDFIVGILKAHGTDPIPPRHTLQIQGGTPSSQG